MMLTTIFKNYPSKVLISGAVERNWIQYRYVKLILTAEEVSRLSTIMANIFWPLLPWGSAARYSN